MSANFERWMRDYEERANPLCNSSRSNSTNSTSSRSNSTNSAPETLAKYESLLEHIAVIQVAIVTATSDTERTRLQNTLVNLEHDRDQFQLGMN